MNQEKTAFKIFNFWGYSDNFNKIKKYEEFLLVSTVYCQRVLQLSYIDVIYLFQYDESVLNIWNLCNFNRKKIVFFCAHDDVIFYRNEKYIFAKH